MESKLIAWGPYNPRIKDILDYPGEFYDGVPPSKIVFSSMFICNSSSQSRQLASFLGINVACMGEFHFNNFQMKGVVQQIDPVEAAMFDLDLFSDAEYDIEALIRLTSMGFEFYFDPGY